MPVRWATVGLDQAWPCRWRHKSPLAGELAAAQALPGYCRNAMCSALFPHRRGSYPVYYTSLCSFRCGA